MRPPLLSRREAVIALAAVAATLGAVELAGPQLPTLPSSVYDWNRMESEPTQTGARRPFFRSRTATLDELAIHATTVAPGRASHPPHRHPDEELVIVKEGTIEQTIRGRAHRLGPGSIAFLAPNDEHGLRNVGDTPATYFILRWKTPATGK